MSRLPVKQFVVGDKAAGADFSPDEIEALIYKIALWFGSPECDRAYDDPVAEAKEKIKECLLAQTADGSPWKMAPHDFNKRVRAKCAYDIEASRGIPSKRIKSPQASRALDKKAKEGATSLNDMSVVNASFDQEAYRAKVEADILEAFPELDNAAHRPNVRSLSGLYAQREVIDRELAAGVNANKRELLLKSLKMIEDMSDGTMQRLDIHPNQIRKRINDRAASSVGDLVEHIGTDDHYLKREQVWTRQLALQLWWCSEHMNGRKSGPQLHDFEIWHMTRSRPSKYTCRCGHTETVIEGFEPKELYEWLVKEGVLIEEPVIPALVKQEDLEGLTAYFEEGSNGQSD